MIDDLHDYLSFEYQDAMEVGDHNALSRLIARAPRSQSREDEATSPRVLRVVNNVWFGSSRFSLQLEMVDWIAYAVRMWYERRRGRRTGRGRC